MNGLGIICRSPPWFKALLLAAFVAGCGSGGGNGELGSGTGPSPDLGPPPTAAGAGTGVAGAGRGPATVPLATAANFVILSVTALTNVMPSVVTGNVGMTKASGALIGLTCAEVNGTIYSSDTSGPACKVTDAAGLTLAETDADIAYYDAVGRVPDYVELGAGNIGGLNLGPATYRWSTGVQIPDSLKLTGGPNDVWIFQIAQGLSVGSGVQIILVGGALPENIYWATYAEVHLGTGSQFKGILLPAAPVFMGNGASINGRLLAAAVHLDRATVGP